MGCRVLVLTALGASMWLTACREPVAPSPAAQAPTPAEAPAASTSTANANAKAGYNTTIKGRIHADLPEASFTLLADGAPDASGVLHVRSIDIRRGNAAETRQRIDGLSTDTPWSASAPGFELLDMNFDGYADMRLIESQPAGPNLPYLNWLYVPVSGQFVASRALNAITAPRFDAAARELHSDWRDSASRYGTDTYAFRDGELVPVRRQTRNYTRAGVYTLQLSRWSDGAWRVVETRQGHDS